MFEPPVRPPETGAGGTETLDRGSSAPRKPYWGVWATVGLGLAIIGVMLGVELVVGLVYFLFRFSGGNGLDFTGGLTDIRRMGFFFILATAIGSVVGVGLVIAAVKLKDGARLGDYLALRPVRPPAVLAALIVVGVFVLMQSFFQAGGRTSDPDVMLEVYKGAANPLLFAVTVIIIVPLFEEAFFRGFLFAGLRYSRMGVIGAVALTAVTWTALHVQYTGAELVWVLVLGVTLGIVRHRTGSLWGVLLIHALNNAAATLGIMLSAT